MKKIIVNDKFQTNYTYFLEEKINSNFHPEFKPDLTPEDMLQISKQARECGIHRTRQ